MLFIQDYLLQSVPNFYYIVAFLGGIRILYQLFIIFRGLWTFIFRKRQNFKQVYGQKSWALVTGSSQGIGKEFAQQFARDGLNVLLLSRRQAKLKEVRDQLKTKYPECEVQYIVADLATEGMKENVQEILPQLEKYSNISIIVNNAGTDVLEPYTDIKVSKIIDLLSINCFALAALNYKFVPIFEKRTKDTGKKCAIINVGSVAGEMPLPLHNVYSASKAYVGQLTNNLSKEYPHINWLVLKPSEVTTAMTYFKNDIFSVSTKQCVGGALNDLGYQVQTNGALSHKIQSYFNLIFPSWFFNYIWVNVVAKEFIEQRIEFYKNKKQN